ncbi:C4-dicarboxylate ABC transporter permease [Chromatiales bacterium (ex Bugula neritina AB1)]|nr:C4-dicarboxylate ABC transporter permease [Chromatiales bacterium (ex Bugula neritina AB1)]
MELVFLALLVIMLALALGSGYPVAFALPGAAIVTISIAALCGYIFAGGNVDAYFAQDGPSQWLSAGVTNLRGIYWEVERDTLIAIPLFIFMGIMLQRSKIAEDLLVTMAQLFGPVPGGLGISVVFVGALLAATTGIVGATVVAMGLISLPVMLRNNYSQSLATGTIAASGTLGQIIPPSIVLIILADQLASATDQAGTIRKTLHKAATGELTMPSEFAVVSTSAGEMFLGALVPGLILVALYMLYILFYALLRPSKAPAVKLESSRDLAFLGKVLGTLVPPLALIFLVLGSIITGIATVNQAGAIGAAGALLMAGYRLKDGKRKYSPAILALIAMTGIGITLFMFDTNIKNIKTDRDLIGVYLSVSTVFLLILALIWSGIRVNRDNTLHEVMIETAKATSLVFIILLGAAMLTAAFRAFGGEELVRDYLNSLPGGFWTKFIIVMGVIFILGFFLDFIEIAVVVVPIVAPILLADPSANITAVWLGVMIGLNIQTSFLTPPFGFALFYLRGVAPTAVKTINMYKGVIAFIVLQLIALGIVGYYPPLVNYLPNRMSLLSDNAPPPRNPKLQYCIEEYTVLHLAEHSTELTSAIRVAEELDLSILPKKLKASVSKSVQKASEAITLLETAKTAEQDVLGASDDYRPLHSIVRNIEQQIRENASTIDDLETRLRRTSGDNADAIKAGLQQKIDTISNSQLALEASIPAQWQATNEEFAALQQIETKARKDYRRAADDSFLPVAKVTAALDDTDKLLALQDSLNNLEQQINDNEPAAMLVPIAALAKKFGQVEGASKIKSAVSKARSALKAKKPNKKKAIKSVGKAIAAFEKELAWRIPAKETLNASLKIYQQAISGSIGIRQQSKLSREQALFVARCSAEHRDISLNF